MRGQSKLHALVEMLIPILYQLCHGKQSIKAHPGEAGDLDLLPCCCCLLCWMGWGQELAGRLQVWVGGFGEGSS
ncbi:hypothetical protein AAFF_G00384670 [Aldrovandia affinis]|uniref:Uncharacterized protein n=1 Tax=Aldrovandia affinis TaxID=143900 RepID=A0AAD7R4Q5_9TELE|nr:hypothetical protein AAFF_G00384670 [Aldrovandia affinis]